jgi:Rps23 Pro-64 3,4-dihydroxylase Tpa1-like proline 4-hydroxylase
MSTTVHSGLLNQHDIDALAVKFQNAQPFPCICIDNFLDPDFANEIANAFPSYDEAKRLGRGFDAVNERGKYQITDSSKFPEPLRQLHDLLAHPEFLELMERMSGIGPLIADAELVGGGIHQTGPRGHLDVHVDFNYIVERKLHRRLNILIFFNRGWNEAWGGNLELWDAEVKKCYHSFAPLYNRCCMFETSEISFHGVTAVKCPEHASRKSFAAYYYTQVTDDSLLNNAHSTIFKARPDEVMKRNLWMPLERLSRAVKKTPYLVRNLLKGR